MNSITSVTPGNAIQNAQAGIARGMAALGRDAAVVANVSTGAVSDADFIGSLIDMSQQKLYVQASAKALSIADDAMSAALGQLVDTHA